MNKNKRCLLMRQRFRTFYVDRSSVHLHVCVREGGSQSTLIIMTNLIRPNVVATF